MSIRRMLPFILINIVVSAVVVLAILYWWDGRNAQESETAAVTTVAPGNLDIPLATPAAETQPQSTNTPDAPPGPPVHVVAAGDTLGNISQFYGVTIADIVAANNLTDPNVISVGQQLIIPVGGLATAPPAPTETAAVSALPSPIPTEPIEPGEAIIEITGVVSPGQLAEEAVQIVNSGSRQIALLDWKLVDEDRHIYTFGQVTLFGDGAGILVHTETGQDGATDLFWGLEEPVWEPGELVTLLNAEDAPQATFTIP
jgi:LysM repeat protein